MHRTGTDHFSQLIFLRSDSREEKVSSRILKRAANGKRHIELGGEVHLWNSYSYCCTAVCPEELRYTLHESELLLLL